MAAARDSKTPGVEELMKETYLGETKVEEMQTTHLARKHEGGTRVERWESIRMIGSGLSSEIWLQKEESESELGIPEQRAVKCIPKSTAWMDYRREIACMAKLRHEPDLFPIFHGWCEDDSTAYLAMEYFPESDLSRHLEPRIPEQEVKGIARQLLSAVKALHGLGLVHRDIKTQNVYVRSKPPAGPWLVKLGDFGTTAGIAGRGGEEDEWEALEMEVKNASVGTKGFMAPEWFPSERIEAGDNEDDTNPESSKKSFVASDPAMDIFSLGVVIFRMLAMEMPFNVSYSIIKFAAGRAVLPEHQLRRQNVSEKANEFLRWLMQLTPNHRPSAEQALDHGWLREDASEEKQSGSGPQHSE